LAVFGFVFFALIPRLEPAEIPRAQLSCRRLGLQDTGKAVAAG